MRDPTIRRVVEPEPTCKGSVLSDGAVTDIGVVELERALILQKVNAD